MRLDTDTFMPFTGSAAEAIAATISGDLEKTAHRSPAQ